MKKFLYTFTLIVAITVVSLGKTSAQKSVSPNVITVVKNPDTRQIRLFAGIPNEKFSSYGNAVDYFQRFIFEKDIYIFSKISMTGSSKTELWYQNTASVEAKFLGFSSSDILTAPSAVLLNEAVALKNKTGNNYPALYASPSQVFLAKN